MKQEFKIKPIGYIENNFDEHTDNLKIKAVESIIRIDEEYSEGLRTIETLKYIDVVFIFHKSNGENNLNGTTKSGKKRGVFASRLPIRPNSLGITTVRLLKRDGNILFVKGLDALNNSPVIDIKSGDTSLFASEADDNMLHNAILKNDPRKEIRNNIAKEQTGILLMKAAQMHGHYCPGLAMGIIAAVKSMNILKAESDGLENLIAITETNNCFSDGIQFVTGCSFGNNALIFKDIGKVAFTLTKRNGKGVRIVALNNARDVIRENFPEHNQLYQKVIAEKNHDPLLISEYKKAALGRAFGTLDIPFEKLFKIEYTDSEIPDYAPSHESIVCKTCGEIVMASRIVKTETGPICLVCSGYTTGQLDGYGIHI